MYKSFLKEFKYNLKQFIYQISRKTIQRFLLIGYTNTQKSQKDY